MIKMIILFGICFHQGSERSSLPWLQSDERPLRINARPGYAGASGAFCHAGPGVPNQDA